MPIRVLLRAAVLAAATLGAQAQAQPPAPLSAAPWTSVKLPAVPLGIVAHGGDLWVCGWDAMIAESGDGGRTWSLRHFRKGGELLFTVAFAGNQHAYAFGSVGFEMESHDGDTNWKRQTGPKIPVLWAQVSDPRHELLASPMRVAMDKAGSLRPIFLQAEILSAGAVGGRTLLLAVSKDARHD